MADLAFAQGRGRDEFGGRHRDGAMFLVPLVLIAAAAVLLFVLWRGRHPAAPLAAPSVPPSPTYNAEVILAERLARGEINPDDYRAAITVLRESPAPPTPAG
jgi:putative membrane protein